MKKTFLMIVVGFIAGALFSPMIGMAIGSTRDIILNMAPKDAILALADKIDQESGRNDAQQQALESLSNTNQEQAEQLASLAKNQDIASCNEKHNTCEAKISAINNKEIILSNGNILRNENGGTTNVDRLAAIKRIESSVKDCKKTRDSGEFKSDAVREAWERCIKNGEKDIVLINNAIANESKEMRELLLGECSDYKIPCE